MWGGGGGELRGRGQLLRPRWNNSRDVDAVNREEVDSIS